MPGTIVRDPSSSAAGVVRCEVLNLTADASDGSFPAVTLASRSITIDGTMIAVRTNPGAVAPTDNYDMVLTDADGLDRFNGVLVDRDTTSSEAVAVTGMPYIAASEAATLTLTVTGNTVPSAVIVMRIYWSPTVVGGAGSSSSISTPSPVGAAHLVSTQVTPGVVSGTVAIARPTRVRCTIVNSGGTTVFINGVTATTASGRLGPGASIGVSTQELIAGIVSAGTGALDVFDEYN